MNSAFKRALLFMVCSTVYILFDVIRKDWMDSKQVQPKTTKTLNQLSELQKHQEIFSKFGIHRNMSLNCRKLFRTARENLPEDRSQTKTDSEPKEFFLEELIKDCPKLRSEHGYEDKPVSRIEQEFPLAVSIKVHTNSHQVERLLRTIYRPHNFYCIHVDSKASDETYDLIKGVADCLKNVVILPKRFNVVYSSIHLVAIEFACMKLSAESGVKWKYYINLTERDFVLRTNLELVEILKIFDGINDIEGYPLNVTSRFEEKFVIEDDSLVSMGMNKPFKYNITFYKGSAYGMFSRDFVDFVLTDSFVLEFYQWLHNTYAPEETIWSTLNRLPFTPGGCLESNIKQENQTHVSRAVIREHDPMKCHGKFVRGICVFHSDDLPWLHSRPEIAANKFNEDIDSVVLDCLEEWVNDRAYSVSLEGFNRDFYGNLTQVKYYKTLHEFRKTQEAFQKRKDIWLKTHDPHGDEGRE